MIPITKPALDEEEVLAASETILSGWVTQGPRVAQFERAFADYAGARYACAVSNCTAALQLALHAIGVGPGDEVITVSHSFIATANAIVHCGATPIFIDIEPATYNMNPTLLEAAITGRTKAILPVHQIGLPADLKVILEIARRYSLPVIEDAACAIGSQVRIDGKWEMIGQPQGAVACFSFHPRKVITTGEGGMITTNDPELDRQFRLLRQHAMSVSDTKRHSSKHVVFESYLQPAFNCRMTDIQAAIGSVQLGKLPAKLACRRTLAERYDNAFAEISGLETPQIPEWARPNYQSYALRVTDDFSVSRDQLMQQLLDRGISTRRGIMNAHQEPAYRNLHCGALPESELARDSVVLLPLYETLTCEQQDQVIAAVVESAGAPVCLAAATKNVVSH